MPKPSGPKEKPSGLWYLLPIFLSIIGGLIGYFILKDRDRKFAERILIVGVVMVAAQFLFSFILAGLAYVYISGILSQSVMNGGVAEITGSYCNQGNPDTAVFTIANPGSNPIVLSGITVIKFSPTSQPLSIDWGAATVLDSGKTVTGTVVCDGSGGRMCRYKLTMPTGQVLVASVYCP